MADAADGAALWGVARAKVLGAVAASRGFKTLRDVAGDAHIPPERLARVRLLGEGAFARVEAARLDGGRLVAVKHLRLELLDGTPEGAAALDSFLAEAALMRKLRHSAIVEMVGVGGAHAAGPGGAANSSEQAPGEAGGGTDELYIVQELCEGGSLSRLVASQMAQPFTKLYSQADALRWAAGVAAALAYLHDARPQVLHRDLKLDNVLLDASPPRAAKAKLADFGLARLLERTEQRRAALGRVATMLHRADAGAPPGDGALATPEARARIARVDTALSALSAAAAGGSARSAARSASFVSAAGAELTSQTGSFGYMAPEVLKGEPYGAAADIFSFGCCLYNLFYRVIPAMTLGGDPAAVELYAWRVADGFRPALAAGRAPDAVNALIAECWAAAPAERPSARDAVERLRAIEEAGVCEAGPGGGGGCCAAM